MADAFKTYVGIEMVRPGAVIRSPTVDMLLASARKLESRKLLVEGPLGPPLLADSAGDRAALAWYMRYLDVGVTAALSLEPTAYQCRIDSALDAIELLIGRVCPIGELTNRHRQYSIRPSTRAPPLATAAHSHKLLAAAPKATVSDAECEMLKLIAPYMHELHGIVDESHLRAAATPVQRGRYWRALHLVRLIGESAVIELNDQLDTIAQIVVATPRAARASCETELFLAYAPMHRRLEQMHRPLAKFMTPIVREWLGTAGKNDFGVDAAAPAAAARLRAWIAAYVAAPRDSGLALHRFDMCIFTMHMSAIDGDLKEISLRLNLLRAIAATALLEVPDDPVTEFDVLIDCVYGRQTQFDRYVAAVPHILNK
jgi:hypothetical protein